MQRLRIFAWIIAQTLVRAFRQSAILPQYVHEHSETQSNPHLITPHSPVCICRECHRERKKEQRNFVLALAAHRYM
jgi:hypothetical protein